jgi:stage II sporulation protein D
MGERLEAEPGSAPLAVNGSRFRGTMEIRSSDAAFTVINELPLDTYLLGVVPNELGPVVFPEIEALKAQAVAARTYIVRNMGQYASQGYDICATEQCQVYFGMDTEHELATRAVEETRGLVATYNGEPIEALYSSTCGGRTEDAENVFGNPVPYLRSTICHFEHPEPQPFDTTASFPSWEDGLLGIAGVDSFADAGRFLGLGEVGEPESSQIDAVATFVRENFYPAIPADSDRAFLEEQGILIPGGENGTREILLRLLEQKSAISWGEARLISWDGEVLTARMDSQVREFRLAPDAAIFRRVGDVRIPVDQGAWMGGELLEIRFPETTGETPTITAAVYRANAAGNAADRYSPVARWQVHQTGVELDDAVRSLGIGRLEDVVILERGPSNRVVRAEIHGSQGTAPITGPRLRTLFGIRDSLVYIDEERNADGDLTGMSFFGNGWGHGVGLCQVGAYGMALDGATAEEILRTYYTGIELERVF